MRSGVASHSRIVVPLMDLADLQATKRTLQDTGIRRVTLVSG